MESGKWMDWADAIAVFGSGGEYFDEEGNHMRCVCVAVGAGADYYPGHDDRR